MPSHAGLVPQGDGARKFLTAEPSERSHGCVEQGGAHALAALRAQADGANAALTTAKATAPKAVNDLAKQITAIQSNMTGILQAAEIAKTAVTQGIAALEAQMTAAPTKGSAASGEQCLWREQQWDKVSWPATGGVCI